MQYDGARPRELHRELATRRRTPPKPHGWPSCSSRTSSPLSSASPHIAIVAQGFCPRHLPNDSYPQASPHSGAPHRQVSTRSLVRDHDLLARGLTVVVSRQLGRERASSAEPEWMGRDRVHNVPNAVSTPGHFGVCLASKWIQVDGYITRRGRRAVGTTWSCVLSRGRRAPSTARGSGDLLQQVARRRL